MRYIGTLYHLLLIYTMNSDLAVGPFATVLTHLASIRPHGNVMCRMHSSLWINIVHMDDVQYAVLDNCKASVLILGNFERFGLRYLYRATNTNDDPVRHTNL